MKIKTQIKIATFALLLSTISFQLSTAFAGTTIDGTNRYAYSANLGWIDWRGDTNNGAIIGEYVCSGYIYSANVGWINLGSGSTANQIQYQNNSATDFGVNDDGLGNLRGYAWSANVGWINFENIGAPKVDLRTGNFSGSVWSANCGWISLTNAVAYVQTDHIYQGPLAPNGLPIPWLMSNFGTTNVNPNADPTGKGMAIGQDYVAGTDPNNANSVLRITAESFAPSGTAANVTWSSVPTRLYYVLGNTNLTALNWLDSGLGLISPSAGTSTAAGFTSAAAPMRFYRVEAVLPLP